MKNNRHKGITLIALVITVVVLLILAGTAISIAINGGDLFGKANQAATSWNRAVGEEENAINGVWNILDSMTGGNGEGTGTEPTDTQNPSNPTVLTVIANNGTSLEVQATGSTDDSGTVYYQYRYKQGSGSYSEWSTRVISTETYTITGLSLSTSYTVEAKAIDEAGKESESTATVTETTASAVPYLGNIGRYVHYNINLGIGANTSSVDDDWVVFYQDLDANGEVLANGYTYLIAADYVPVANEYLAGTPANGSTPEVQGALAKAGLSSSETYFVYASSLSNATMDSSASTRYKLSWNGAISSSYLKHTATVALLNTTAWSGLALTDTNSNITAVGAPTVDLWIASWEQRGYTPLYITTNKDNNNVSTTGYYIGIAENPTTTYQSVAYNASTFPNTGYNSSTPTQSNPSVNNPVYFPRTTETSDNCNGYWLASPSAYSNSSPVMIVRCYGDVDNRDFCNPRCGVRPVVSLPSNIIGAGTNPEIYYVETN